MASNRKGKGKEPASSQPLPKYKGKKGANVGGIGPRSRGRNSIAARAERIKRRAAGGPYTASDDNRATDTRRLPPPVFTGLNNAKDTSKRYTERLRESGIPNIKRDGTYKRAVPRNRVGGPGKVAAASKRSSGMSKKQVKNPKR